MVSQAEWMLELIKGSEFATGADFSHYKGEWDLSTVDMGLFNEVMDFCILRAGYGAQDGRIYKDLKFEHNYAILQDYPGILRGVYWYFSSHSPWENQRDAFLSFTDGKDFDFFADDIEELYNVKSAGFALTNIRFMKALQIEHPGKRIFNYSNRYTYVDWVWNYTTEIDMFPYWVAQYPWRSWVGGLTDYFKSWWTQVFTSLTKQPHLPNHLPNDHWELWQLISASGIGHELGFESDELDFNISRRPKLDFINWIGKPKRWNGDQPEEPSDDKCIAVLEELHNFQTSTDEHFDKLFSLIAGTDIPEAP